MSCDQPIGSNQSIEDIQLVQSVSLPFLGGMIGADYHSLSPKRDISKKGKYLNNNNTNHKPDTHNNNSSNNNMPISISFATNSSSHDIGIPQDLRKTIDFGDISANQPKYRSSNQQVFIDKSNFPDPPSLEKVDNDYMNNMMMNEDDKAAIPIPISWKPELFYNRRTSATSTTSTVSAISTISNTTFSFNDEIQHNLADDLEDIQTSDHTLQDFDGCGGLYRNKSSSPVFDIPLRPLIHDITQLHPAESIDNPQESYESESESDHDDSIPTPKAQQQPPSPPQHHCGFSPIGSHDCDCGCNDGDHSYGIGYRKQSTQKLLNIQVTATTCDYGDAASTCDYNDSLPNASPQLRGSPSSLDDLPPLPGPQLLSPSHTKSNEEHDTNDTKNPLLFDLKCQEEDDDFDKQPIIETIDIEHIEIETKFNEDYINITNPTTIKPQQLQQQQSISYKDFVDKNLLSYDWQKPIVNERNYGAYFPNFQKEIMQNPFFKLTAGDFNDVLKKCQFIRSRWLGEKIRSTRPGSFGKAKWKAGEKITELDLFAIKLYTDFESCQRELKKCYRPPSTTNELEMRHYESRYVIYIIYIGLY